MVKTQSKRDRLLLRSWRFCTDKQGNVQRTCTCSYCRPTYKRDHKSRRVVID